MNSDSMETKPPRSSHPLLKFVGIVSVLVIAYALWIVLGPGATSFAGGNRVALADYKAGNPTGVPADMANASRVDRGHYLARAADCEACHTAKGGEPYAGGLPFVLPFGTIYSVNITPDEETGIGGFSDAAFLDVIHKGIDDEGHHLYPVMPFTSYTALTDADALAIKAYLFSLKPVHAPPRENVLSFPFNQRPLMGIWAMLFNPDKRFEPTADRSAGWNRGAYLAEGMAHCGECHTPRNVMQALDNRSKYAGALTGGWRAYNITADAGSGVGTWSDAELAAYLSAGHASGRGSAGGPMGEAVDKSLQYLSAADIAALVEYVKSVPAIASPDLPAPRTTAAPVSHAEGVVADYEPRGKAIFEGSCVSCHAWTGAGSLTPVATLTGSRAVNDPTATNVAQVVLGGANGHTSAGPIYMPAFGASLSDVEVAAVANYVTARFGAKPSAVTPKDVAQMRKAG